MVFFFRHELKQQLLAGKQHKLCHEKLITKIVPHGQGAQQRPYIFFHQIFSKKLCCWDIFFRFNHKLEKICEQESMDIVLIVQVFVPKFDKCTGLYLFRDLQPFKEVPLIVKRTSKSLNILYNLSEKL